MFNNIFNVDVLDTTQLSLINNEITQKVENFKT